MPTATGSPLFFENREQIRVEPARNQADIASPAGDVAHAERSGTPRGLGKPQKRQSQPIKVGFEFWWPGAESNHRHKDFQSSALPTELPGQSGRVYQRWHCDQARTDSGGAAFSACQIDAELLQFAVQMGAFQAGLFGHAGHRAVFFGQVVFEIRLLEFVACFAQRFV